jgi:hypothetical protein
LDLAGAKNQKTALAVLEYYPREQKIFLLDIYERISAHDDQTGDEALIETIREARNGSQAMLGVDVPLELPPCVTCTRKTCPLPAKCNVPAVKWMREFSRKTTARGEGNGKEFTPYTQRPVELWVRHHALRELADPGRLEVDEALGGTKAPLTARMQFLKRHLADVDMVEAWPKLTVACLASELGLPRRTQQSYRQLEAGVHARSEILEALSKQRGVFIYERDLRKLSASLPSFDAFFCAYTALLSDAGRCAKAPSGFPVPTGWVHYPRAGAASGAR